MIGIYVIINNINEKKYIGQSKNILQRWREHRSRYQTTDSYLYRAMRKYGLDSFTFKIITECDEEELDSLEQYWISVYKTNNSNFGYNLTPGGNVLSRSLYKISNKEIFQIYDLLKRGVTQQKIAEKFNISQQQVSLLNSGKSRPQKNISYPIITYSKKNCCIDCGKKISKGAIRCKKCNAALHHQQKVSREQLKELIRNKPFTQIGKQFGVSDTAIRKWCDYYKLPRKSSEIKKIPDSEWFKI